MEGEARFCSACGARLESRLAAAMTEETRSRVMSTLRGEERLVTVVFADLTDSVRRTADLSPEEATGLVNPLLEAMVELIIRHGGRIDRFLGDGVLAVFGVPNVHEDDPLRAVRAAVDLRERAMSIGLAVTIGVNTGRVYFGPVGSSLHEELTVMGPAVNLAARLQSAASADQILVGEATGAHVEEAFHLVPVTLTIKGMAEPVTAYRAEYQVDHPEKVRGIKGLRSGLIGRDAELTALQEGLDEPPRSYALVGPAGVGKSRLAAELNQRAEQRGFAWLEGRCREETIHLPYGPFVDLFRRRFGASRTAEAVSASLEELVAARALKAVRAAEIIPFLTHLLGEALGDERDLRVTESDPDRRRRLTISAVVDYLAAAARFRPTLLFLDDLHWSDGASLELVEAIYGHPWEGPLVLVSAFRPEANASVSGVSGRLGEGVTVLALRELTAEQSSLLVHGLLDVSGIPASLEERIVANSGGNPFYVEEMIRSCIQRGVITRRNDRWVAEASLEEVPVPESVEGLVMSRFDRLGAHVKQAARVASVLGEEFTESHLTALGRDLRNELLPMAEAGLISITRAGADPEHAFMHALTRHAIYASLLPSHRAELHGRAAAALEAEGSDDFERLAHHYEQSRNDAKAVEYLLAAAERALAAFANDTARRQLESGLDRVEKLTDEKTAWRSRYRARLGELLERQADHDGARRELEAALEEIEDDPMEEARLLRIIGQTHRLQSHLDQAHVCYDRAESALDRLPDRDSPPAHRAWIDVQQERSHALYFGGRGRELPDHNARLRPVVEAHGSIAQQVDLRRAVSMDQFVRDRFCLDLAAVDHARLSLEMAQGGADPGRIAETTFVLGFTLLWADQVDEAASVLERAVLEAVQVGDVIHEGRARAYLAIALRRAGHVDEAAGAARQAMEVAVSVGSSYYQGHAHATLCWVAWRRGDGTCLSHGREAYRSWGELERDGHRGYDSEFAWMAIWPVAARSHQDGEHDEAANQLRLLLVPWERPLPPDLRRQVATAAHRPAPEAITASLDLAREHRFL